MAAYFDARSLDREISAVHEALALTALIQYAPRTWEDDTLDPHANDLEESQAMVKHPNDAYATRFRRDTSDQVDTKWCSFLDALCVLCWFGQGGSSVVSIAAHERNGHARFVLTTNGISILEPVKHLREILHWLQSVHRGRAKAQDALEHIIDRSIARAKDKILNYRGRLKSQLKQLREVSARAVDSWDEDCGHLCEVLDKMLPDAPFDLKLLCEQAYDFRRSSDRSLLLIKASGGVEQWRLIRHYIGRLGSYHAAAWTVIANANDVSVSLQDADVDWIEASVSMAHTKKFKLTYDLATLVAKVCPQLSHFKGRRDEVISRLSGAASLLHDLQNTFQTPVVHAEAAIAHHFYTEKLNIVRGVRYIGCSKASCYCCDVYFSCHPAQLIRRSCSGRAWLRWDLPRRVGNHPQETSENLRIVHEMLAIMHQELDSDIDCQRYGIRAEFDSTTGMSIPRHAS